VLVEGVGGFRVPLGDDYDTADLARDLALPVILVVGMRLGCINHALLTAEAIQPAACLAGWVANQVDPAMLRFRAESGSPHRRMPAPLLGVCLPARRRRRSRQQRLPYRPDAPLAQLLEQAHPGGHPHVEGLHAARHRDQHPRVASPATAATGPALRTEQPGHRPAQVGS
jgi:hypothetical protein